MKPIVSKSMTIGEPVDGIALQNEAHGHHKKWTIEVKFVAWAVILVETCHEHIERHMINDINGLFVIDWINVGQPISVLGQQGCAEANDTHQDQHGELHFPKEMPDLQEHTECACLVALGDHFGHFQVSLGLKSTLFVAHHSSLVDLVGGDGVE